MDFTPKPVPAAIRNAILMEQGYAVSSAGH